MPDKENKITQKWVNDETVEYKIGRTVLFTTNHDEDGWSGMDKVEHVIEVMCETFGIKFEKK